MTAVPLVPFENTPYSDPIFPGLPVPDDDPQNEPKACLTYNANWQPILVALASRLTRYDAWLGNLEDQKLGVRKGHELIAQIQQEHCPEGIPADICTEFLPENPFTTYYPQNPFTSPGYIPNGYAASPFVTDTTNIIYGIVPTDVVVDLFSLPVDIIGFIASGAQFPRVHIELSGTGECELHFKKVAQGGFCTVTIDGNPLTVQIVDLNAVSLLDIGSLFALLGIVFSGSLGQPFVHEIEFTTLGDHTIDITFFPHLGGTVLLGFGGVFSGVNFCANSLSGDMNYMPITDMRVNQTTCKWEAEYNNDGMWVEIGDYWIPACVPEIGNPQTLIQDPGNGQLQQSLDGGLNYDPIPNAHFLHINADNDPLLGKLDISPPTDVTALQLNRKDTATVESLMRWNVGEALYEGGISKLGRLYLGQPPSLSADAGSISIKNTNTTGAIGVNINMQGAAGLITAIVGQALGASAENDGVYARVGNAGINKAIVIESLNAANNNWALYSFARAKSYLGGRLGVGFGNASPSAAIHAVEDPGSNSGVLDLLILGREYAAGASVAGFGLGVKLRGKSSTTNARDMALLTAVWDEPTDATRKAQVTLSVFDTAPREVFSAGTNGNEPTFAMFGQTRSPRADVGVIDCAGNEGAKAALDALVTFGWIEGTINLGAAPASEPGINARPSRCQTAVTLAGWIYHHSYAMASREAWYTDALYFVGDRTDSIKKMLDVAVEETTNLLGWVNLENTDFTLQSGAAQEQHLLDMQAYFESIAFQEALYCALSPDPDPHMDATDYLGFLELLELMAVVGQPSDYAFEFMRCFNEESIAVWASQAALSPYFVADADCGAFGCGESLPEPPAHDWCATYDFRSAEYWINESPDPKWDSYGGSYVSGQGWLCDRTDAPPGQGTGQVFLTKIFAVAPTIVQYRVKIGFMEVDPEGLGQNIVIYRDHASETDNIPIDMAVGEKTYISEFGSANAEINVWLASNPLDVIYIRSITLYGTGSEPSDIDGIPCP